MRRIVVVVAALGLSMVSSVPSFAQEARSPEQARSVADTTARELAALKRDVDRLRAELTAAKKQIEELRKGQNDVNVHVEMLLKHRHQLFVDFMRADAFFPKAKGTFFVTTPSPEDLTKTSGPVSGPK